jgi:hypothetical protein
MGASRSATRTRKRKTSIGAELPLDMAGILPQKSQAASPVMKIHQMTLNHVGSFVIVSSVEQLIYELRFFRLF